MHTVPSLQWLQEQFLPYLENWEESVRARDQFTLTEQNKMLLSVETRLGLQFTGKDDLCMVFTGEGRIFFFFLQ